jgi:hypothetical protein
MPTACDESSKAEHCVQRTVCSFVPFHSSCLIPAPGARQVKLRTDHQGTPETSNLGDLHVSLPMLDPEGLGGDGVESLLRQERLTARGPEFEHLTRLARPRRGVGMTVRGDASGLQCIKG